MRAQRLDFYDFGGPPKPLELQRACSKNITFTISGLSFRHRKSIVKSCFFKTRSCTHFLILFESMPKSSIFGPPSKSRGVQNGIKNHPSGAQRLSKSIGCAHFFAILKPIRFQKVARSARGFILYDLLCILAPT